MYLDWTYIVLVLPAVLFSLWASARVNRIFSQYSAGRTRRGMTGAAAARAVLDANGLHQVQITRVAGDLTDHYDPKANVIRLSDSVYDATSCAAIGVAAHEAGHAIQHAQGYGPLMLRNAIIPVTNFGSKLSIPLILLLSLGLALLLRRGGRGLLFALLVPLVLPSGVTAFFWNAIFSAGGLINKILYLLGQPLINWKTSAAAMVIPIILFLWKNTGLITAIMLIGCDRIPQEYYEIAAGEGATPRVCFYKVTLPYLAPTVFLAGLIAVIQSFKVFRELYILFGAYPNPYLYQLQHYMNNQFSSMNLQKLSAASHILFVLMAAVILLTYFMQKRLSDRFTSVELSPAKVVSIRKKPSDFVERLALWTAAAVALLPLLFTVANSFLLPQEVINRYSSQVLPGNAGSLARDGLHFVQMTLLPTEPTLAQYEEFLLQSPEQLRLFWNSALLIVPILLGQLVVSVLAAYAFERSRWKYKEIAFAVYLVILLMPMQVTLVPNYITADLLGLLDSYWAIILPAVFHPLGVFFAAVADEGF